MIGQTVSHYKILAKIGEGATGVLYRALDTDSDRSVAIRVLAPAMTTNPERRQRMEHDALTASSLQHPNIAAVYEFSESNGVAFAVMEAPEGESAYDFLKRERPRRRSQLQFAQQIAGALEAAHGAGIVHGPLDPAAIFINSKSQIKIHDFGFSILEPPEDSEQERLLSFGKSAPYISPEQVKGDRPDVRSDIFSFGAFLYYMTTGRRPFRAETISGTWKAILEEEAKPIDQVTRYAVSGMERLVERCLRKKPQRRFQQFAELRPVLQTIVDDYLEDPERETPFLIRHRRRIMKIGGLALAATAAVAVVAAAINWWRTAPTGEPTLGKQLRQVSKNSGLDTEPSISRDGDWLAYASDRNHDGKLDIWVQPAGGGEARQLTNDSTDNREPVFSPDGKTIAFHSERNGGGVYLVPAAGGDTRLIAAGGRRPRYSPDGRWIAYWVGPAGFVSKPNGAYKIFIVPSEGGVPRQIRPDFASATFPIWSPDGKSLLFVGRADASRMESGSTEWWVSAVEGEGLHNTGALWLLRNNGILLEAQPAVPGDWNGNHIFFSIPVIKGSNIWRADIAPESRTISRPLRVTSGKGIEGQPSASGDSRIFFASQIYKSNIWGLPVVANEGRVTGNPKRWTSDASIDVLPSMPADGATLLFQSNRTGPNNMWLLDVKSGKKSPVLASVQEQLWPIVSTDGSKVAYSEVRIGRMEHFYTRLGGGRAEVLCEDCGPAITSWSPDGKMVLIDTIYGEHSRASVSAIKLSPQEKIPLLEDSQQDLSQARFSPDGRWVAFAARKGGLSRLYVTPFHDPGPLPPREWIAITDGTFWDAGPQWSPDGKLIYFASTRDGYRCVWAQRLDGMNKPSGQAIPVAHFHTSGRSPALLPFDNMDLFVARDQILVSLGDQTGNIWSVKVSD